MGTHVMPPPVWSRWSAMIDMAWSIILQQLSWKDISHARAACRAWRRDVDRCLHRLHLRNPTPASLHRLGNTFSRLQTVKLTVLSGPGPHKDHEAALNGGCGLPGALGGVRVLRLRSKRPGGAVLPVGQLQLLRGGAVGASLTCLCLSACEVQSWSGLQACHQLTQLQVLQCTLAPEATRGMCNALAALPRLTHLELRTSLTTSLTANDRHRAAGAPRVGPLLAPSCDELHLVGLAGASPRLTVLKLGAALSEGGVRSLLRGELPGLGQLRELELHLRQPRVGATPGPQQPQQQPVVLAAAQGPFPAPPPAPAPLPTTPESREYLELANLFLGVAVGAPQLTALRVEGHTRVQDRDLMLLQPLHRLRALILDLPPHHPHPHHHHQQPHHPHLPFHHPHHHHHAGPEAAGLLSGSAVCSLLAAAPGLTELSLAHVGWSPEGLRALGARSGLLKLRLAGVELPRGHTLCPFLHGLRSLPALTHLELVGCGALSDWGLALLGRCGAGLRVLRLRGSGELVGDVGVGALASLMGRLEQLDLAFLDKLTDNGLAALLRNGAPVLKTLSLSYCPRIKDAGVLSVAAACPVLQFLDLDGCVGLSAGVGPALRGMSGLRRLSAEGCPQLLGALEGLPAARPTRSQVASRWWLAR